MKSCITNPRFISDYEKLKTVTLNPRRHTAGTAYEHCELVCKKVIELAELNSCTADEKQFLENMARLHDIGKINGTANPAKSVELIEQYGSFDELFIEFVKYHDINLPWYQSTQKGQTPGDKAWKKLSGRVDIKLLCIFMIADRVDCPGGWMKNAPLVWFLGECKRRKLIMEIEA